jgi:excisionase family DNA binding protein
MAGERDTLKRLEQALQEHRRASEALEEALLAELRSQNRDSQDQSSYELLSIQDLCQELKMGKSWVYRRLKSGQIPSIKLGHNIKVRRKDLEEYLEDNRYRPSEEE